MPFDLVSYDYHRFRDLSRQFSRHLEKMGLTPAMVVPISAWQGDHIVRRRGRMPWNLTPTLLEVLEGLTVPEKNGRQPLRFLVQCVFPAGGRQVILGKVVSGSLHQGQTLTFGPGGQETTVASILLGENETNLAGTGQCVGLFLQDPVPVNRGCVGFEGNAPPVITHHVQAGVFWIDSRPLEADGPIELLCGTQSHHAYVEEIAKVIDPVSLAVKTDATDLNDSEVGEITVQTDSPMCIDPFAVVPELGRFAVVQDGRIKGGGVIG